MISKHEQSDVTLQISGNAMSAYPRFHMQYARLISFVEKVGSGNETRDRTARTAVA